MPIRRQQSGRTGGATRTDRPWSKTTLRDAGRNEREAFIFYTIEGFTLDEIADITNHTVEEVRAAIRKAREHLQRALPMKDPLKDRLVEYSKSA